MRPIEIFGSQLIGLSRNHATPRAEALGVRIALGCELLERGASDGKIHTERVGFFEIKLSGD